ncbi:DUF429 domain-containing protein [Paracoccaceae bacterium GXU_MW_L88]
MTRWLGVDGSPGGWVGVLVEDGDLAAARAVQAPDLGRLLAETGAELSVVDIPIGLPNPGETRLCDQEGRNLLGDKYRSLFPVACREVLFAESYEAANEIGRRLSKSGISTQLWGIAPKIREVDALLKTLPPNILYEGHPEISFKEMTGAPLMSRKDWLTGLFDRLHALENQGFRPGGLMRDFAEKPMFKRDDLLDAAAMAWTASRIARGTARSLPQRPDPFPAIWI